MKTSEFLKWSLLAGVAALPLAGCAQKSPSMESTLGVSNVPPVVESVPPTNSQSPLPDPEVAEAAIENAPAKVVAPPRLAPDVPLSQTAAEVVKLAQAGVDQGVMLAFVTNSSYVFALNSDDIIYLNDVGVPEPVVTAMLQQDQSIRMETSAISGQPPVYTNQLVQVPGAPTAYPDATQVLNTESAPQEPQISIAEGAPQSNAAYTYFYDSLSPYGTWIDVEGYGRCWQPTVVLSDRSWTPYGDRGHWVYTDAGWYWASDYSWGWAPFHYGRWFQHSTWGWCWAPDTVWGPSWVSWRYTPGYCGWAPLPPTAYYNPGFGFSYYGSSVSWSFGFGLGYNSYIFVPSYSFCDRYVYRHRIHHDRARDIYRNSVVMNRFERGEHNRVINRGVPVDHIASASRTEIRPVRIREMDRPGNARMVRTGNEDGRTLAVYRPNLPEPEGRSSPLVGGGVRPATRDVAQRIREGANQNRSTPVIRHGEENRATGTLRDSTPPNLVNRSIRAGSRGSDVQPRPGATLASPETPRNQTRSIILRGPGRTTQGTAPANEVATSSQPQPITPAAPQSRGLQRSLPAATPNTPNVQQTPRTPATQPQRVFPTRQITPQIPRASVAPQVPSQAGVQQPATRIFRQESPAVRVQPQNIAPSAPIQRQIPAPTYQAPPRIIEQRPAAPIQRAAPMERMAAPPQIRSQPNISIPRPQAVEPTRSMPSVRQATPSRTEQPREIRRSR